MCMSVSSCFYLSVVNVLPLHGLCSYWFLFFVTVTTVKYSLLNHGENEYL